MWIAVCIIDIIVITFIAVLMVFTVSNAAIIIVHYGIVRIFSGTCSH